MIELESPQIEPVEEAGTYAKYEAGPLQAGYGVTLAPPEAGAITTCGGASSPAAVTNAIEPPSGDQRG